MLGKIRDLKLEIRDLHSFITVVGNSTIDHQCRRFLNNEASLASGLVG